MELFLFAGLPVVIGIIGVAGAEVFRARNMPRREEVAQERVARSSDDSDFMVTLSDVERAQLIQNVFFRRMEEETRELVAEIKRSGRPNPLGLDIGVEQRFIDPKRAGVLIGKLRERYGKDFAKGMRDDDRLADVLARLDMPSLGRLIKDYDELYTVLEFSRSASRKER